MHWEVCCSGILCPYCIYLLLCRGQFTSLLHPLPLSRSSTVLCGSLLIAPVLGSSTTERGNPWVGLGCITQALLSHLYLIWLQGIELKQAAANPLLGQFHLQDGGRFVRAKLPSATVGRPGSRAENGDSDAGKQQVLTECPLYVCVGVSYKRVGTCHHLCCLLCVCVGVFSKRVGTCHHLFCL